MEKAYDHQSSEKNLYAAWETSGAMRADETSDRPPFTIPLPPPNVTGNLHLGHAAMLAIEDIMIRYKRMQGHEVLWVPGTDHAAIATENVVIKHHGKTSREQWPTREAFMDDARAFATEKHDNIVNQMKRMGSWLDWSREAYTFDEARNHAVNTIFKDLYEDGLIERGYRLINWSVGAQSVLSDDELEYDEVKEPFYYIKCGRFVMGTVRPETKCADSPLVVHPTAEYVELKLPNGEALVVVKNLWDDQERFFKTLNFLDPEAEYEVLQTVKGNDLVGETFTAETYAGERSFHVIADEVIDPEKGSGAMTISASHSADDYDLAKRLKRDDYFIEKIDFDGNMTAIAGPAAGMFVKKARNVSGKLMEEKGLLVGKDANYQHRVPLCYRSNCVVEPMISPQWFIMVEKEYTHPVDGKTTLKAQMQNAVRGEHVQIIPERFDKEYFRWIDNLQDWCISRQIWWGHRIPVWYDEQQNVHLAETQNVLIVRHGQSENNANKIAGGDSPLTSQGEQQARDTAAQLQGRNIAKVISSPLERSHRTAQIIAEQFGLEVEVWDDMYENNYGDLENGPELGASKNFELAVEKGTGESPAEVSARAHGVIKKLKNLGNQGGEVVLVGHNTFNCMLFAAWEGVPADQLVTYRNAWHMDNAGFKTLSLYTEPRPAGQNQTIIFARHGESQGNRDNKAQSLDDPLTDKGRQHAKDMIDVLKGENVSLIVSGTALRNTETADIMAQGLGVEVLHIPELSSYDFGEVSGMTIEEIGGVTPIKYCKENGKGEDFGAFVERLKVGLEKLKNVRTDGKIVFVTNRSIYSVLQTLKEGGDPDKIFEKRSKNSHLPHGLIDQWTFFQPSTGGQTFVFARHGESEGNRDKTIQADDEALTEKGEQHAQALGESLQNRNITRIIASSSKRAVDTAQIVADQLGLEVETMPELASYDYGSIVGTPDDPNHSKHERALALGTGESPEAFIARTQSAWQKLMAMQSDGEILVVSHRTNLTVVDELKAGRDITDLFGLRAKNEDAGYGVWGEHTTAGGALRQDEDTLDTWFSSALWPFSTLGWPNNEAPDFQKFYNNAVNGQGTDVLETGWDILFFWVARMIMFSRYATGKYPFHTVYLHGMVTDEHGKKMSKSKGNGIDPLEMIDEYGADPVRLALVIGSTPGQKIPIGRNKIKGYRNFVNKLWNASRFVGMQSEGDRSVPTAPTGDLSLTDQWILSRLSQVSTEVSTALDNYDISTAGDTIYHFVWGEFCDWYLEASKVEPNLEVLRYTLAEILKLTHPLCPFITEQCWHEVFDDTSLMDAFYPKASYQNDEAVAQFATVQNIVGAIRTLRAEKGLNPKDKIAASIKSDEAHLSSSLELIKALANLSELEVSAAATKPEHGATTVVDNLEIFVDIPFDEAADAARLEKDRVELEQKIAGLKGRLSNPSYTEKAPPNLVAETRAQLEQAESALAKLS